MEHLIGQSLQLALPDGLKELMADISREVLRAQPENLNKFISDYLAALLVTREHLSIACFLCGDVCDSVCRLTLVEELRARGLSEDAERAAEIIVKYFEEGGYGEENILLMLVKSTNITEKQLPTVRQAIESAFLKQKLKDAFPQESSPDLSMDSVTRAVQHTMKLYEKTEPTQVDHANMALKIQAAYKAYGVQRQTPMLNASRPQSFTFPHRFDFPDQRSDDGCCRKFDSPKVSTSSSSISEQRPLHPAFSITEYDELEDLGDMFERENNSFDYTSGLSETNKRSLTDEKIKKISFSSPACPDIIEYDDDDDDDDDDDNDDESTYAAITKSDFAEDTKVMEDGIAEVDENEANEFKSDDTLDKNDFGLSKVVYDSLTEVKESKRFVADSWLKLGDEVDHCHIRKDTDNAKVKNNSVTVNFTKQSNESIRSIDKLDNTNMIDEA